MDPRVNVAVASGAWTGGLGGYYFDDLIAVRSGAEPDGLLYEGDPVTRGHDRIRNPGRTVLTVLVDGDGCMGFGDAAAIQYSGVVGRDPVLDPDTLGPQVDVAISELATAGSLDFSEACQLLESLTMPNGRRLHTGIRYGLSQAFLQLVAIHHRLSMAEALRVTYKLEMPKRVPIFAQSGEERYRNVDKMILKEADALPHGLINSPPLFGSRGSALLDYVSWVRQRVRDVGRTEYAPTLHFDIYGLAGFEFGIRSDRLTAYCDSLQRAASPYKLRLETPVDGGSALETARALAKLRRSNSAAGVEVALVADDWCNTSSDVEMFLELEAVDMVQIKTPDLGALENTLRAAQTCQAAGVGAFVGGTCNETDISARACVHVAAAVGADLMYAKPGMGVDEGLMIVRNELGRIEIQARMMALSRQAWFMDRRALESSEAWGERW